jgi:hypothetical protein
MANLHCNIGLFYFSFSHTVILFVPVFSVYVRKTEYKNQVKSTFACGGDPRLWWTFSHWNHLLFFCSVFLCGKLHAWRIFSHWNLSLFLCLIFLCRELMPWRNFQGEIPHCSWVKWFHWRTLSHCNPSFVPVFSVSVRRIDVLANLLTL